MVRYVPNPPEARPLMTSARSFGNYDLAGALADLIDNSLNAGAHNIELYCLFNEGAPKVSVIDDGHGMSETELHAAMRPASQDPLKERSLDDLGRFGWGMKSASFSQCKRLTVISIRNGKASGAVWDHSTLDNWQMGVLSPTEIVNLSSIPAERKCGTEVIWNDCDRLSENETLSEKGFNALVAHTKSRLALTFHRFLAGTSGRKRLSMSINGHTVSPYDPFCTKHNATQILPPEILELNGKKIKIQPYVLPHYSKLRSTEHDRLAGTDGLLKNQGFYVYRNDRLIIKGTWFRLAKFGELAQLVRISVDIPNSLDDLWKITVDKSDAQLPSILRTRLSDIVAGLRKRSSKVNRSKGGKVSSVSRTAIWTRYARKGEINYHINREHPLISALLESDVREKRAVANAALLAIEQGFPVEKFGQDSHSRPDDLHQTEARLERFRHFLEASVPCILSQVGGDFRLLKIKLQTLEPYCSNWVPVKEYLDEKGWTDEGP